MSEILRLPASSNDGQKANEKREKIIKFLNKYKQYQSGKITIYELLDLTISATEETLKSAQRNVSKLTHPDRVKVEVPEREEEANECRLNLNKLFGVTGGMQDKNWTLDRLKQIAKEDEAKRKKPSKEGSEEEQKKRFIEYLNLIVVTIEYEMKNCNNIATKTNLSYFSYSYTQRYFRTPQTSIVDGFVRSIESLRHDIDSTKYLNTSIAHINKYKGIVISLLKGLKRAYIGAMQSFYSRYYVSPKYVSDEYLQADEDIKKISDLIEFLEGNSNYTVPKGKIEILKIEDFINKKIKKVCIECNVFERIRTKLLEKLKSEFGDKDYQQLMRKNFVLGGKYPKDEDMETEEAVLSYIERIVNEIYEKIAKELTQTPSIVKTNIYLINPIYLGEANEPSFYYYDTSCMPPQMYKINNDGTVEVETAITESQLADQYIKLENMLPLITKNIANNDQQKSYFIFFGKIYNILVEGEKITIRCQQQLPSIQQFGQINGDEQGQLVASISKRIEESITKYKQTEKSDQVLIHK